MCRAGVWLLRMPETVRSCPTTVPWVVGHVGGERVDRVFAWIRDPSVWIRVTSRRAVSERAEGRCPVRRSGPTRRDNVREAVRSALRALFRCRGLGTGSPVDSTARALMPRSTPTVASGRAGALTWRATSTVNAQYQRPASRRTVADRIRAVPVSRRRASLRVDSCVLIVPTLGKVTCCRSVSTRITPVVNRTLGVVRRRAFPAREPDLAAGTLNRTLESAQFFHEMGCTVQAGVERLCVLFGSDPTARGGAQA